ncbi:lipid-A-disaccharide synthase [Candidiatus Paracoxiella cheracis]|uniref:lipid-A-disaccharide synthase n=1 Tax=Candidiatus Paracoxiella cheracis TaxID=3405120 RepID=UPI003BF5063A
MHNHSNQKILIVAGEASGDLLGAHLAKAILALEPNTILIGMGGPQMQSAGVDIIIDADKLAVVGVWEILKHLGDIRSAMHTLKQLFKTDPPDLVIFIDYPGFNLRMAKQAKRADIKVLYYVSPQIWAWRYGRIKKIKKYVDRMAVLFAFEEKLYQKEDMPVSFVGHPLVDIAIPTLTPNEVAIQLQLDTQKPIIALFPGSRHSEITRLMPVIVSAVELIRAQLPAAQFVLPLASSLSREDLRDYLIPEIQVVENNTYNLLPLCTAAICASGTATLEIALQQIPLLIIYKVAPLSFWLGKNLIKTPFIGLCNIVAEEKVALELIQHDANATIIAEQILRLVTEPDHREKTSDKLAQVKLKLGGGGGSEKVARVALNMLRLD